MRYSTILLDPDTWDLVIDAQGNIAVAQPEYSLAQDVASAIMLFKGELWYDTTKGVPYQSSVLGKRPPIGLLREYFNRAAMTVPGVVSTQTALTFNNRQIGGQVLFVDEAGAQNGVKLS